MQPEPDKHNTGDDPRINLTEDSLDNEFSFRPRYLEEFIGQKRNISNLKVYIQAAKERSESLEHILLSGPPGLGKTTLANIVAREMDAPVHATSAPAIEKSGELAAILTSLEHGEILFIDEIHRLPTQIEEILYPAMEDREIDIMIGQGPTARSIKLSLKPFTLIGATTRPGLLSSPLTARFGIAMRMEYYEDEEMVAIVQRAAKMMALDMEQEAIQEIAKRGRRTPRLVLRLLRRVRDFAQVAREERVSLTRARFALEQLDIDELGLDPMDRKLLITIIDYYRGGPVGLKTLAAAVAEDIGTIEDIYEPFLIQSGLLQRTSRGRIVTPAAYEHLRIKMPSSLPQNESQGDLF